MLLVLDMGNTDIKIGVFQNKQLIERFHIATDLKKSSDEYYATISSIFVAAKLDIALIEGAILASVVPPLTGVIVKTIESLFNVTPLIVGPGTKTGLKINIDHPNELGSDLVIDAVSVKERYGYPAIIIDLGTANKIMALDKNGDFVGVSFTVGIRTGVESLSSSTAQLPQVSLKKPSKILGKNTADSINSGAIYGTKALLRGLMIMIEEELGYETKHILTGGYAKLLFDNLKVPLDIIYDQDLSLHGLRLIYNRNHGGEDHKK